MANYPRIEELREAIEQLPEERVEITKPVYIMAYYFSVPSAKLWAESYEKLLLHNPGNKDYLPYYKELLEILNHYQLL